MGFLNWLLRYDRPYVSEFARDRRARYPRSFFAPSKPNAYGYGNRYYKFSKKRGLNRLRHIHGSPVPIGADEPIVVGFLVQHPVSGLYLHYSHGKVYRVEYTDEDQKALALFLPDWPIPNDQTPLTYHNGYNQGGISMDSNGYVVLASLRLDQATGDLLLHFRSSSKTRRVEYTGNREMILTFLDELPENGGGQGGA